MDIEQEITKLLKTHFYYIKTHRFLQAGEENRAVVAYGAVKSREPWTYSFSLEAVINYERNKSKFFQQVFDAIGTKDDINSPHLRQLAAKLIESQTHTARSTNNELV
jgi:hypothetical protein